MNHELDSSTVPFSAGNSDAAKTPASNPLDQSSRADLLRLAMLPGLGPRTLTTLLEHFHSPRTVLAATEQALAEVPGVGASLIHKIRHAGDYVDVDAILSWCADTDVRLLTIEEKNYPRPLRDLCDAPPVLFCKGSVDPSDDLAVAIVGTRHATPYGLRQAERIAYGLARAGITIISGLARGIDAAAHRGALDAGGRTMAVLGGGLQEIYPAEHEDLAQAIAKAGAVLSEFRPDARPRGGMFPQRNRLVSGLSMAVLVVEAPQRSGALITARLAGEQGRDVYALPGQVTARASQGCHQLLRDGATLIRSADDILEELGPVAQEVSTDDGRQLRNGAELLLNEQERAVLDAIETECTSIDSVVTKSRLPVQRVLATISVLESRKLVRRLSGQYVSRA